MGNIPSQNPPKYNPVLESKEIQELIKEHSIYDDICKHYNLGNKFDRLEKYFSKLTYDDICICYINYVELVEPKDKIIMKIFSSKYINEYQSYIHNLKKK
jgi:hypothetical protein